PEELVGDATEACYFLRRAVRMYQVANRAMPVLMTMRAFSEFRTALGPSSGFQSLQFRRLEILSGVREPYWRGGTRDAAGNVHPAEIEFEKRFGAQIAAWLEQHAQHNLRGHFETLRQRA